MRPALSGIRVVDMSESAGGQYCARLLADYGAEVILIEPEGGSAIRQAPPLSKSGESLLFLHLNTGKRSVRADARSEAGQAVVRQLLKGADVVVLPHDLEAAYAADLDPTTVAATISPFGPDGPFAHWKGPEIVLQALSGMMHNNGAHGREPLYGCGHRASFAAGIGAYIGIVAALYARPRIGSGQRVTVDEAETAAAMCFPYVLQHIYNGTVRSRSDQNIPAGQVRCRDGWVCIWIYNHRWTAVCRTLALEHLVDDPRFADPLERRRNWDVLFAIIQATVADHRADELVASLQGAEVIAARAFRPTELHASEHLRQRGYWETVEGGTQPILGPPYRLGRSPRGPRTGPPELGESDGRLAELASRRITPAGSGTKSLDGSAGPLAGLRIIELTTAWAGPMAGRVLGYLGAQSIHVESPNRVNSWRLNKEVPNPINFPDREPGERPFDRAFLFNSQNVNKLSCILDLKSEDGREVLRRLVAVADVLICNFRPGTLKRLGLDYEALARIKPDIIVAELPAFGTTGPMARHAALGPTMEMATGMSSMIGYPGGQPETTGPSYLDPIGGFNAAAAILTALLHRQATGEGQAVEVPQVEAAMHLIGAELLAAIETGRDPEPNGNLSADAAPHDAFPAKGNDQWVAIAARSEAEWSALCRCMEMPGLRDDPRFATREARLAHQAALSEIVAGWTLCRDKHEVARLLQSAGVPAAPVQTPADVARCEYLAHKGFFTVLDHSVAGRHPHPGLPIRLSRTPGRQVRAAPPFGGDNRQVLEEILGLAPEEVAAIAARAGITTIPLPGA